MGKHSLLGFNISCARVKSLGYWHCYIQKASFSVALSRAGFCIMTSLSAPLHLTVSGSFEGDAHLLFLRTTPRIKQSVPDGTQAKAFSIHGLRQCKKPA